MGVCNSPDIFQENIFKQFDGFDMVRAYIYDVLVITKNDFEDYVKSLDRVLQRLEEAGLKVNAEKYFMWWTETGYLGFRVRNIGVRPLLSKVEVIKSINVPTKVRGVRRFVGLINYYRKMWRKHAQKVAPLTKLCSTKVKFKWTDVENTAFIAMKNILGQDVLIYYPKFRESL